MTGYQLADNVSLAGRNTFRVAARAAMMADVSRADALAELFEFAMLREGEVLVVGEGSNLLFAGDFPGVAICLTMAGVRIVRDDGDAAVVRAEAGLAWNDLVGWTLARGLVGLENMALIPGTVGAAPIQNIGAYGVEVGEFIEAVQAIKAAAHVPHNQAGRASAVPDELAASEGFAISQQKRKRIEQGFGWGKFIGPIRQVMVRGIKKVDQVFMMAMAAYNLVRMRTLGQVRLQGAQ
mgnify:CR=1 FL=1